jgi:hypothetical protein
MFDHTDVIACPLFSTAEPAGGGWHAVALALHASGAPCTEQHVREFDQMMPMLVLTLLLQNRLAEGGTLLPQRTSVW